MLVGQTILKVYNFFTLNIYYPFKVVVLEEEEEEELENEEGEEEEGVEDEADNERPTE